MSIFIAFDAIEADLMPTIGVHEVAARLLTSVAIPSLAHPVAFSIKILFALP